jgi:hypothetical protein
MLLFLFVSEKIDLPILQTNTVRLNKATMVFTLSKTDEPPVIVLPTPPSATSRNTCEVVSDCLVNQKLL